MFKLLLMSPLGGKLAGTIMIHASGPILDRMCPIFALKAGFPAVSNYIEQPLGEKNVSFAST